jgi:flagellar hook-length control protein FliK
MLQFNLLLPATPDGARVSATANAAAGGLLDPDTGEPMTFAAELHALLMALSPEQLERLQGLLQGGMSLPQAASAVLAVQQGGTPPALSPLLPAGTSQLPVQLPPVAADTEPAVIEKLVRQPLAAALEALISGDQAELRPALAGAGALLQGSLAPLLSGPLGSNLLAMGIPQRVGTAEWADAVNERVFWMAQGGQQFARLQLNPPNLGPLEVRLNLSQDQASVSFIAGQAAVREALEAALPRLRDMLEQQSILLVRAEVRDPGNGSAQQDGDFERGGSGGGARAETATAGTGSAAEAVQVSDRLVDLFA